MKLNKTLLGLTAAAILYTGTPADAQMIIIKEPRYQESLSKSYATRPGRNLNTYLETKRQRNTPAKVWEFFKSGGIEYVSDQDYVLKSHDGTIRIIRDDFMQDPIDTYNVGKGDCEDYAAIAQDWLTAAGFEAKIIGYFGSGKRTGHVICAVREQNGWSCLANDVYVRGYSSIKDMVNKIKPDWTAYYELALDKRHGSGMRIFNEVYRNNASRDELESFINRTNE